MEIQACLPVKDLDLGYNLLTTHDGKGAFVIIDHDELDPKAAAAPMSFVYSAGSATPLIAVNACASTQFACHVVKMFADLRRETHWICVSQTQTVC